MKMYEVDHQGQSYWTLADSPGQAIDLVCSGEVEPMHESVTDETKVKALPDCNCGICHVHGYPWACHHAEPDDIVHDLARYDRCWK